MFEKVKVVYHDPELHELAEHAYSDWIDLRAAEDIKLKAWEYCEISLGVSMQLPEGYEAIIAPRSSTFKNFGIIAVNSIGVIDESYCGNSDIWHLPVLAIRDTEIRKNDRICQFRLLPHQPYVHYETVLQLDNPNRGGLGSTGVR